MRRLEVMRLQVVLLPFAWMSTLDAMSYCLMTTIYRLLMEVYYACFG